MAAAKNATHYSVTGPAVVLKLKSKGERYLYRGAPIVASAFDADSIQRAVDNGLIAPVEAPAAAPAVEESKGADAKASADAPTKK